MAAIAVLLFMAFAIDYRGWDRPSGKMGGMIAGAAILILLAVLGFLAIRWQKSPETRGRALGIWIGTGVAFLIEGTCFLVNSR